MSGIYARVADVNPVSYLVEGIRALVIDGLTLRAVVEALAVPAALAVATLALSIAALNARVRAS
jgi:ABC-2 type transport system permease protein